MLGRLTGGACGPLLVGCVLVAVVWAGSYRSSTALRLPVSQGGTLWQVVSYRGLLGVSATPQYPTTLSASAKIRPSTSTRAVLWDSTYWSESYLGFSAEDGRSSAVTSDGTLVSCCWCGMTFPYWLIFAMVALVPASRGWRALQCWWRRSHGRCGQCGYENGTLPCAACAARSMVISLSPRTHLIGPA